MLSCLTKLLNLLCLKCLGSTSAASSTGSDTMRERPSGAHSMHATWGELTSSNLYRTRTHKTVRCQNAGCPSPAPKARAMLIEGGMKSGG